MPITEKRLGDDGDEVKVDNNEDDAYDKEDEVSDNGDEVKESTITTTTPMTERTESVTMATK